MIKKIDKIQTLHANGDVLHQLKLYSDLCDKQGDRSEFIKFEFLLSIHNQPNLSYPGGLPFESMALIHNGTCWLASFTALEKKYQVI